MKKELAVITLLILILTGCQANETPPSNNNNVNTDGNTQQAQQIKSNSVSNNSEEATLQLEKLAKGVDGVEDAHVVIIGNVAIVGIDVDPNLERSRVGTIKYSVSEALRDDKYGKQSIVTADIDLGHRLSEIRQDIETGKPVQGFVEELADIVGRIVPQIPADLMPAPNEVETKSTKENNKYTTPDQMIRDHERKLK